MTGPPAAICARNRGTTEPLDPSTLNKGELLDAGLGITNAAMRVTRGSGELRRTDFAGAVDRLSSIERTVGPAGFAFVGKQAYAGAFSERSPDHGLQKRKLGGAWSAPASAPSWTSPSTATRCRPSRCAACRRLDPIDSRAIRGMTPRSP